MTAEITNQYFWSTTLGIQEVFLAANWWPYDYNSVLVMIKYNFACGEILLPRWYYVLCI